MSSSSNGYLHHAFDFTSTEVLPPPPKRRRVNSTQQEQGESGSHYDGPITLEGSSRAIIGNFYETHNHIHAASPRSEEAKLKQLIDSLAFRRMDARLHNVKVALKNTCQWLLRHKTYRAWMDDKTLPKHKGFLWIKGKPGCGKSTLMKGAYLSARGKAKKQWITLSYFFNARAPDALEKSPLGLYRSLVHEILRSIPQSLTMFDEMFSWKHFSENIEWTIEELQGFLVRFVQADWRLPAIIFIDALDEGIESDIRALLSFLQELIDHSGNDLPLRICLSSRHYPHITIRTGLSLIVEEQPEHDRDIERYVHEKLVNDDDPAIDQLKATVCARSAGIFLWVFLIIPILNQLHDQGKKVVELTAYLETLPKDLEGLFAEILARDPVEVRACVSLLQWVLYSDTHLNSVELYLAIQHSWSRPDGDVITIPIDTALARYILNHSRGLVEITKSEPPVVQFIHETVREFLAGKRGLAQVDPALATNLPGWSHARLAQTCFSYFIQNCSMSVFSPECTSLEKRDAKVMREKAIKDHAPFLPYAVTNLLVHAEAAQLLGISQKSLLEYLQTATGILDPNFRQVHNFLEEYTVRRYGPDVTLLYAVAEKNFPALLTILLTWDSPPINKVCGRYGNALQAACHNGSEKIVRSLLQRNADVNAVGGEYSSALGAIIATRHFHLFDLLRTYGLSKNTPIPNKVLNWLWRPKLKAISDARELFLKGIGLYMKVGMIDARWLTELSNYRIEVPRTLEKEADIQVTPLREDSIVTTRLSYDQVTLAELLLGSSTASNKGLETFARHGYQRLMRIALEQDLGSNKREVGNALIVSSGHGHLEIVQMLLDWGADINFQDLKQDTALHVASAKGQVEVVKKLLDSGAEIDMCGSSDKNALHEASSHGHVQVVEILLDRGADIDFQGRDGLNAIYYASQNGHYAVVEALLRNDARVDLQDREGWTALGTALFNGHVKVVELLLDSGADPNLQGASCMTNLQWASWRGHLKVVQMLLDRGADVNLQDMGGRTALHDASCNGHIEVVQLLLDRGANCNPQDRSGETPLHEASRGGYFKVVQMLLDRGADINAQGLLGTPLHRALREGHQDVVQLLRAKGGEDIAGEWG